MCYGRPCVSYVGPPGTVAVCVRVHYRSNPWVHPLVWGAPTAVRGAVFSSRVLHSFREGMIVDVRPPGDGADVSIVLGNVRSSQFVLGITRGEVGRPPGGVVW